MPVYRDYEIRINLNELIEQEMHVCDALHPDHCLTEEQISTILYCLEGYVAGLDDCIPQEDDEQLVAEIDDIFYELETTLDNSNSPETFIPNFHD